MCERLSISRKPLNTITTRGTLHMPLTSDHPSRCRSHRHRHLLGMVPHVRHRGGCWGQVLGPQRRRGAGDRVHYSGSDEPRGCTRCMQYTWATRMCTAWHALTHVHAKKYKQSPCSVLNKQYHHNRPVLDTLLRRQVMILFSSLKS